MAKYSDEELAQIVGEMVAGSAGADQDEITANRTEALDYYFARKPGGAPPGRSQQVSTDVADMTNAVLAQIVPMISTDAVVDFEPAGEDDAEQARLESRACNRIVMDDNRGFLQFEMAIKDALLLRNGVINVEVEEHTETETWTYGPEVPNDVVGGVLVTAPPGEQRELVSDPDDDTKRVRVTRNDISFVVRAVATENCVWTDNLDTLDLQAANFFAERRYLTRSELVAMGIDRAKVDELPPAGTTSKTDTNARNRSATPDFDESTRENDILETWFAYPLLDMDDDGISERWQIVLGPNNTVLRKSAVNWVPYAGGSAFIHPHRFMGESLYDHLRPVQDTKTAALRQWVDNLVHMNNQRLEVVEAQTNMDDALTSRPGGAIRVKTPGSVTPLPVLDGGPSSMALMQYQDKIRAERGGAALDMMAGEAQIVSNVAEGTVDRQFSSKEQMAQMFAKNLAETLVRDTYLLVHRTLRAFATEPLNLFVDGNWVEVDPTSWQERKHLNVNTGMSVGQRRSVGAALGGLVQLEMALLGQYEGVLVGLPEFHRTLVDWLTIQGVNAPENYLTNPQSDEAQQVRQGQQQQAQQQQQILAAVQQQQQQMEEIKLRLDKYMHDTELEFKYAKEGMEAEIEETKIVVDAELKQEQMEIDDQNADADRRAASNGSAAG
jgi:hypothetical protein